MSATEILEQIRRLPPAEQHEVAERVWAEFGAVDDRLTAEQIAELESRAEEFRENPQGATPWEQVRDKARKRFGWK
jgi:putative addiction module component (TIGR02574 family)